MSIFSTEKNNNQFIHSLINRIYGMVKYIIIDFLDFNRLAGWLACLPACPWGEKMGKMKKMKKMKEGNRETSMKHGDKVLLELLIGLGLVPPSPFFCNE